VKIYQTRLDQAAPIAPPPSSKGTVAQVVRPFLVFTAAALLLFLVSRIGLVAWQHERVRAAGGLGYLFAQGLRFDLAGIAYALVLPALCAPLLLSTRWTYRPGSLLLRGVLSLLLVALVFLELATPAFIGEYDARPNYLFVEYLRYPREVLGTLWGAYRWWLLLAGLVVPLAGFGAWKLLALARTPSGPLHPLKALLLTPLIAVTCIFVARSSLGHRPANQSTVAYSSDAMVNTLPMPSFYTLLMAIHDMRRHERGKIAYGDLPYAEVLDVVRADSGLSPEAFTDPEIPTLHRQVPTRPRARPLNLVIVLEESMGAEFVGSMGGLPLTPELDELAGQGMWMENLYATGTRSVRGIEAVVTSFLPTPAAAVVKLPRSERGFFSIAELLDRHGYATSFMYGGEANFDNMRRFFAGNGFQTIIERQDFDDPSFVGSWGVCDEDLFRRAHAEFEAMGDKPFFSLVFSSSNHSPWEFPEGGFELYEEPAATRNNAVKYADHALGELFDLARGSSYWDDTVFLVVADHNSRVYGSSLVPVERFHVPALFLGGSVAPERVPTLASQVDLLPTALSLIGLQSEHPSLGRDLTDPAQRARPGRAILQFNDSNLFLEGERAVLFRPDLPAAFFTWDGTALSPAAEDAELGRRALAHALWPQLSYRALDYRLPALRLVAR
jgi:phosphoglycerol transferase MdoB-like AlkP superfamily enzyme